MRLSYNFSFSISRTMLKSFNLVEPRGAGVAQFTATPPSNRDRLVIMIHMPRNVAGVGGIPIPEYTPSLEEQLHYSRWISEKVQ